MEIPDVDLELLNKKESADWVSFAITEEKYSDFIQVFTDRSKNPIGETTTAVSVPVCGVDI